MHTFRRRRRRKGSDLLKVSRRERVSGRKGLCSCCHVDSYFIRKEERESFAQTLWIFSNDVAKKDARQTESTHNPPRILRDDRMSLQHYNDAIGRHLAQLAFVSPSARSHACCKNLRSVVSFPGIHIFPFLALKGHGVHSGAWEHGSRSLAARR